jgi:hypothetical protein
MKNKLNLEFTYENSEGQIFDYIKIENKQFLKKDNEQIIVLDNRGFQYASEDEIEFLKTNKKLLDLQRLYCERTEMISINYDYFENRIKDKRTLWTFNDLLKYTKNI